MCSLPTGRTAADPARAHPAQPTSQVEGLTEGSLYEFKIAAANLAGIGQPSDPSELFKCEAWTMPEPGERPRGTRARSAPVTDPQSWRGSILGAGGLPAVPGRGAELDRAAECPALGRVQRPSG